MRPILIAASPTVSVHADAPIAETGNSNRVNSSLEDEDEFTMLFSVSGQIRSSDKTCSVPPRKNHFFDFLFCLL